MLKRYIDFPRRNRYCREAIKLFFACSLTLALAACATVTTRQPDGSSKQLSQEEYAAYAEQVFRRQNSASQRVIYYDSEAEKPENIVALEEAEENMLEACQFLNQIVMSKIYKEDETLILRLRTRQTIDDCDYATRELEALLQKYGVPSE